MPAAYGRYWLNALFRNQTYYQDFVALVEDLNVVFEPYLPANNLTAISRTEQGFHIIYGDGVAGAINSSLVIPQIAERISEQYPHIPFRYGVAIDGYDRRGLSLLR